MRASANDVVGLAHAAQREVVVEDVEALRPVFGRDRGAVEVVDDVVLDEAVVAAVDGDAPLELRRRRAAVDGVAHSVN